MIVNIIDFYNLILDGVYDSSALFVFVCRARPSCFQSSDRLHVKCVSTYFDEPFTLLGHHEFVKILKIKQNTVNNFSCITLYNHFLNHKYRQIITLRNKHGARNK